MARQSSDSCCIHCREGSRNRPRLSETSLQGHNTQPPYRLKTTIKTSKGKIVDQPHSDEQQKQHQQQQQVPRTPAANAAGRYHMAARHQSNDSHTAETRIAVHSYSSSSSLRSRNSTDMQKHHGMNYNKQWCTPRTSGGLPAGSPATPAFSVARLSRTRCTRALEPELHFSWSRYYAREGMAFLPQQSVPNRTELELHRVLAP